MSKTNIKFFRNNSFFFCLPLLFIFFAIFTVFPQIIFAAGERDPNFGANGSVIVNFGGVINILTDAVLQADGKIVVVGRAGPNSSQESFALARLNADGSLDASFGAGGKVLTDLDNNPNTSETLRSVAIQPDGKIVVGGSASVISGNASLGVFAIVRYNTNGTLDQSFGSGGKVYTNIEGSASEAISKILLLSDGKILAFAEHHASGNVSRILVVRYRSDGYEDNVLGQSSRLFIDSPQNNTRFYDAVIQQPGDRILISGWTSYTLPNCSQQCQGTAPFLTRYSSDFILDRKFGRKAGREVGAKFDDFTSVAILPDGTLAVAGKKIRRFTANGRLDTTFAAVEETTERAVQKSDGKFAGCGSLGIGTLNRDVITSLYNPNGTLIGTDRIDIGTQDFCSEILSQTDGKFLVAGTAYRSSGTISDFFLVRYLNITP
jgi:uncharacterized delta-60 repeat protein